MERNEMKGEKKLCTGELKIRVWTQPGHFAWQILLLYNPRGEYRGVKRTKEDHLVEGAP